MMSWFWVCALLFSVFMGMLYAWYQSRYKYWKKKGVEGPAPSFVVGNIREIFTGNKSLGDIFFSIYNETKHLRYFGAFMMHRPTLVINDLELIKSVLVKDFIHFSDHSFPTDDKVEPLSGHLFLLCGEKWKNLRNKLTPTFTTSRIKKMFDIVAECAVEMTKYLEEHEANDGITDVKEILAKLNTDVIGSCAFGIDCNSFINPDADFRRMGKKIFKVTVFKSIMRFFVFFMPEIAQFYRRSILGKELNDFFYNTVKNTIKYREDNNIVRNDFLQLLIQLKNDGAIEGEKGNSKRSLEKTFE